MYNLIRHSVWNDDWQMTKNNNNIPPKEVNINERLRSFLALNLSAI